MADEKLLTVDDLSVSFDVPQGTVEAVRHVSFDIAEGEVYGLLGHNGAGKSTTLGIILGMVEPNAGEARIAGVSVQRKRAVALRHAGAIVLNLEDHAARAIVHCSYRNPPAIGLRIACVDQQIKENLLQPACIDDRRRVGAVLHIDRILVTERAPQQSDQFVDQFVRRKFCRRMRSP